MWISLGLLPKKMSVYKLNIVSISELLSIDITLTEVFTSTLNKTSSPCSDEKTMDFNTCSHTYFLSYFKNSSNCTLPGIYWNLKKSRSYNCTLQFIYINRKNHMFKKYGIFQKSHPEGCAGSSGHSISFWRKRSAVQISG